MIKKERTMREGRQQNEFGVISRELGVIKSYYLIAFPQRRTTNYRFLTQTLTFINLKPSVVNCFCIKLLII